MRHEDNTSIYRADEGKTIVRREDGFVMGTMIDLGELDSIDNYEEAPLTEENDIEGVLKREERKRPRTASRRAREESEE